MSVTKFNTVDITRVIDKLDTCTDHEAVVAMLENDICIVSTATVHIPTEMEHRGEETILKRHPEVIAEAMIADDPFMTSPQWGYYIGQDYPGWVVTSHYNT